MFGIFVSRICIIWTVIIDPCYFDMNNFFEWLWVRWCYSAFFYSLLFSISIQSAIIVVSVLQHSALSFLSFELFCIIFVLMMNKEKVWVMTVWFSFCIHFCIFLILLKNQILFFNEFLHRCDKWARQSGVGGGCGVGVVINWLDQIL